ncbi:hypothetical protein NYR55_13350 [Sphingomonas sp. BGYR3]|uniref:hypothetical protein n=1 Tax=Sphingomonas sp. BGYR3 TaxID=2975483 RepID=UPI0021A6D648|nr:hypothetical protein [Sphingomonas sp. BGYR3]MDG5489604.1 hypothetical protein [Sphingomonas sp. BGYR3]
MLVLLLATAMLGDAATAKPPTAPCDQPVIRHARNDHPPAQGQTLNREPLADQEKAVMRNDGRGCMVPVRVRENIGNAQQR